MHRKNFPLPLLFKNLLAFFFILAQSSITGPCCAPAKATHRSRAHTRKDVHMHAYWPYVHARIFANARIPIQPHATERKRPHLRANARTRAQTHLHERKQTNARANSRTQKTMLLCPSMALKRSITNNI